MSNLTLQRLKKVDLHSLVKHQASKALDRTTGPRFVTLHPYSFFHVIQNHTQFFFNKIIYCENIYFAINTENCGGQTYSYLLKITSSPYYHTV